MPGPSQIRNIGIIAHIDAGKTTLSERMLFYSQKIHRMGEVHDGAATMDFLPEEQGRGITIASACATCQWHGYSLNLIDTPGHVDFTMEVERSLRVLDGAIGVFCGVAGVESQSETVWRQSEKFGVPKIAFINKMDRSGADYAAALDSMRQRLGCTPLPLCAPLGEGENFAGVLDLVSEESLFFSPEDQGRTVTRRPQNSEERKLAEAWREQMLESLAEADEIFLARWIDGRFGQGEIRDAIRRACIARKVSPVFCGSALRNAGVQPLLDAVCAYLPSPLETGAPQDFAPGAPASALLFKVIVENGRPLSLLRVYSGTIMEGDMLYNLRSSRSERAARIYRMHADKREQMESAKCGEIAAVVGLAGGRTGDTYAQNLGTRPLAPIVASASVITIALEPLNADEAKTLDEALERYAIEDPTLRVTLDDDGGTRMLSGMGELHLEVVLERMRREYGISPRSGSPRIVQRESIEHEGAASAVFDRELGKDRHHGAVELAIRPRQRGEGNRVFFGGFLPPDPAEAQKILPWAMRQAVLDGIDDALESGPESGWPICDAEVEIRAVGREDGLTTLPGLSMAAGQALRQAIGKASSIVLEPLMNVEIDVPEENLGAALNLLAARGGKVEEVAEHAGTRLLKGLAPMRRLFGFSTDLRSATRGRAGLSISFCRFDRA